VNYNTGIRVHALSEYEFSTPLCDLPLHNVNPFVKLSDIIHIRYALAVDTTHGFFLPRERMCYIQIDYESEYLANGQSFGTDFGDNVVGRVSRSIARLQYDFAVAPSDEVDRRDLREGAFDRVEIAAAQVSR
jgi:hypothetical protein